MKKQMTASEMGRKGALSRWSKLTPAERKQEMSRRRIKGIENKRKEL